MSHLPNPMSSLFPPALGKQILRAVEMAPLVTCSVYEPEKLNLAPVEVGVVGVPVIPALVEVETGGSWELPGQLLWLQ